LGDFNGDGQTELMNYGYNCSSSGAQTNLTSAWRLNRNNNYTTNSGKVTGIINGYGDTISVSYASLAGDSIYTKGAGNSYPVVDYTLPFHAVKTVTTGGMALNYKYGGLKAHLQGKGLLGMTLRTVTNTTLGTVTTDSVGSWNPTYYVPDKSYTKMKVGGNTAQTVTDLTIAPKDANNILYFAYPSSKTETDLDGNTNYTTYQYNTNLGYITQEKTRFNNNNDQMYKTVQYDEYVKAGGRYQPQLVTHTQKHTDDTSPFIQKKHISYNTTSGLPSSVAERSHTSKPFVIVYAYDAFGNQIMSAKVASGIGTHVNYTEYDATKRFVTKTYTSPASEVRTYTYDTWGNVLTEKDETNSANILTTTHTYNGWGDRTHTTLPDSRGISYYSGWSSDPAKRFYTLVQGGGQPWVKTWYDYRGREVLVETVGAKNVSVKNSKTYNNKGQLLQEESRKGSLIITGNYMYDNRGRLSFRQSSSGYIAGYSYGNRSETTTTYDRTHTKTYDAWGNIKTATDPASSVTYTYASQGKPKSITAGGATFSMTYYDTGMQQTLTDPNAGTTTYVYDAFDRVTQQTDALGNVTVNKYDAFGRLDYSTLNGVMTDYTYGASGNDMSRLTSIRMGNDTVSYSYDYLGRVIQERKHGVTFGYAYNSIGKLSGTTLPALDNVQITREYDAYGHLVKVKAGTQNIWELTGETGLATTTKLGGTMTSTETRNDRGWPANRMTILDSNLTLVHSMGYDYDYITGDLIARVGMFDRIEKFQYDNLGRLKTVKHSAFATAETTVMSINYQPNGNIEYKTGAGEYAYESSKPHAATWVSNESMLVNAQDITYTGFNKVSSIDGYMAGGVPRTLEFTYGPTQERKQSVLRHNQRPTNNELRTITYAGDYEKVGGNMRYYIYGGDGLAAIYTKPYRSTPLPPNAPPLLQALYAPKIYYVHPDHLGSIVKLTEGDGTTVFKASYDAWGKQKITTNTFMSYRGYTGHEHIPEFGLINMNGRMYDPVLGRFLSPDPYVQAPDFSQNFNRYSYCLNNPLKYTDPSGELFGIDDMLVITAFAYFGGMQANFGYTSGNGTNPFNPGNWNWSSAHTYIGMANGVIGGANMMGYSILPQVPGMITNGGLQAGMQLTINGIGNLSDKRNFFDNWYWSAGMGFVSGAVTGYGLSKERGLNYWWGSSVGYNRTQWSFFNTDVPDYTIDFNIPNVGSLAENDCVPTTFAEIEAKRGGSRTYEDFANNPNYSYGKGHIGTGSEYREYMKKNYPYKLIRDDKMLFDANYMSNVAQDGEIISIHFGPKNAHADNVRALQVFKLAPEKNRLIFRQGGYNFNQGNNRNNILSIFRIIK
jgi:RHS repeat-associated protein